MPKPIYYARLYKWEPTEPEQWIGAVYGYRSQELASIYHRQKRMSRIFLHDSDHLLNSVVHEPVSASLFKIDGCDVGHRKYHSSLLPVAYNKMHTSICQPTHPNGGHLLLILSVQAHGSRYYWHVDAHKVEAVANQNHEHSVSIHVQSLLATHIPAPAHAEVAH